ncbi:hypothetical protein IID20_01105 [Patescibacteria group bacterium]|nr:hypothetical protein [Patescibacteria group bacterium]
MFKNRKKLLFILLVISFLISTNFVFAQGDVVKFRPQIEIPGSEDVFDQKIEPGQEITVEGDTFAKYIISLYNWAIRVIILLAIIMIMIAGFQWMTAAGNAPKVTQAKERIASALIGVLLAVASYTILSFINPSLVSFRSLDLTGVDIVKNKPIPYIGDKIGVWILIGKDVKFNVRKKINVLVKSSWRNEVQNRELLATRDANCGDVSEEFWKLDGTGWPDQIGNICYDAGTYCYVRNPSQVYYTGSPFKWGGGRGKQPYVGAECWSEEGVSIERSNPKAGKDCPEFGICVYNIDNEPEECGCMFAVPKTWLLDADDSQTKESILQVDENKGCGYVSYHGFVNGWNIGNQCSTGKECVVQEGRHSQRFPIITLNRDCQDTNDPCGEHEFATCLEIK